MVIFFSWMGILGYALLAYGIFAEHENWAFFAAAFFLVLFLIKYHSLNPFKPWMTSGSKNSNTNSGATSDPANNNTVKTDTVPQQPAPKPAEPPKEIITCCPSCGEKLQQDQIYCENCGTKVK